MRTPDPDAAFAALRAAEPDVMDRDQLASVTEQIAELTAWVDAVKVRVTRRQRQLAEQGRAEAPRDLLAREGRQSGKDARTADERERVCSVMPGFEDALAAGTVSAGHVDAIAGAIRNLDEPTKAEFVALGAELLKDAERSVSICSIAAVVIWRGISTRSHAAAVRCRRVGPSAPVVEGQALDRSRIGDAPHPDLARPGP